LKIFFNSILFTYIGVSSFTVSTAFGIFLASNIEGRNVLMDGFGLIAFASVFPMITVMTYSIIINLINSIKAT